MSRPSRRPLHVAQGLVPLALAAILVVYILAPGPGLESPDSVVLPEIIIENVKFVDSQILANVRNIGHIDVRIVQADINDRIQPAAVEPDGSLGRLESALVRIPYEWNTAEPYTVGITIDDGTRFTKDIDAAVMSVNADALPYFVIVGLCVGVIPVMIGLLWKPFVSRLAAHWRTFVLAVTMGLLIFIAADTMREALEVSADWEIDAAFNGPLLALIVAVTVFLAMQYVSTSLRTRYSQPVVIAILVTVGIAMHNLGEGLAIGASIGLGEAAFTSFLIIGLALHNMTEGFAITAPLASSKVRWTRLAALGLVAGLPVIAGTISGGLFFSPLAAIVLLAAASGAVIQVVASIAKWLHSEGILLSGAPVVAGLCIGMSSLYLISILV